MKSIRVKNLRSLKDSGDIELKKINLFVGRNSSGKSTLLRVFPLLKQSLEQKTRGPILWAGDYTDFGNFETSLYKGEDRDSSDITFEFKLSHSELRLGPPISRRIRNSRGFLMPRNIIQLSGNGEIKLALTVRYDDSNTETQLSKILFKAMGHTLELSTQKTGASVVIKFNGETLENRFLIEPTSDTLIPTIFVLEKNTDSRLLTVEEWYTQKFIDELIKISGPESDTKRSNLTRYASRQRIDTYPNILKEFKQQPQEYTSLKNKFMSFKPDDEMFRSLAASLIIADLVTLLRGAEGRIERSILSSKYIAPVRANANRFYRSQEIAIEDIDQEGKNLPMFVSALGHYQVKDLNEWLHEYFNIRIKIHQQFGHASLELEDGDGNGYFNLADMGFGYGQLLPILVQSWLMSKGGEHSGIGASAARRAQNRLRTQPRYLVVEQPEVHLHPKLQAKLAEMLVKLTSVSEEREGITLLLETHSQDIVNTIGDQIAKGKLDSRDVAVYIFEKSTQASGSTVQKVNFNKSGFLESWPVGFFARD